MSDTKSLRGVYRFAVATSCCTILLLVAGALVTSNDAADSVPDWPLAYHRIIPPLVGGIRYEYAHRVIAGLVSIFTLILGVWLARSEKRSLAKRLGWTALGSRDRPGSAWRSPGSRRAPGHIRHSPCHPRTNILHHDCEPHALSQPVVAARSAAARRFLVALAHVPSRRWTTSGHFCAIDSWLPAFATAQSGINPHIVGACVLLGLVVWTGIVIKRRFRGVRELRRGVALLHATFWNADSARNRCLLGDPHVG